MKHKRAVCLSILLSLLSGLLFSCSEKPAETTESPINSAPGDRTEITVSYMDDGSRYLPMIAEAFNEKSEKYYAVLREYSSENKTGDDPDSYAKLLSDYDADLLGGKLGDVLILTNDIDYLKYAEKGAFADLYSFEGDGFSFDSLFDCVRAPYELDGKLFVLIPGFQLNTLTCKTANAPAGEWTLSGFVGLLNTSDREIIQGLTRDHFFSSYILRGLDEFIDYESKACDFASGGFEEVLKYLYSLPDEIYSSSGNKETGPYINDSFLFNAASFYSFSCFMKEKVLFGLDNPISIIGYPADGEGVSELIPSLYAAVSESSEQKEGAWEFLKFMLENEFEMSIERGMRNLPSCRSSFLKWAEAAKSTHYFFMPGSVEFLEVPAEFLDEATIAEQKRRGAAELFMDEEMTRQLEEFIGGIKGVTKTPPEIKAIVEEEVGYFYDGRNSASQTSANIQNRVSLYLAERQ
ncbi:MAG TPA: hypothetical protein GX704_04665 [Clostridiales bacterium]|nr:hypothetical protein [Clostridiales bacterium]